MNSSTYQIIPDVGAAVDQIVFNLWSGIALVLWWVDRTLLGLASALHWFRRLLVGGEGTDNLLGTLMTALLGDNPALRTLVAWGVYLAALLLGLALILRVVVGPNFQPVDLGRVFLWLLAAYALFSAGPQMVGGVERFRNDLQAQAYSFASAINYRVPVESTGVNDMPLGSDICPPPNGCPRPLGHILPYNTGPCPGNRACNGLDVAAYYLMAEEGDVTGLRDGSRTGGFPAALHQRYFLWRIGGTSEERQQAIATAQQGALRLLMGGVVCYFAVVEAGVFLMFAVAAVLLFVSVPVALPFAFFSLTEIIITSLVKAYLFLLVRTYVASVMLAFLVSVMVIFAERGNALVFVSVSGIAFLLAWQFVGMAKGSVVGALNAVGSSVGSATGVAAPRFDPIATVEGAAKGGVKLAGVALTGGAGAIALGAGAAVGTTLGAATLARQYGPRAVGAAARQAVRGRAGSIGRHTPGARRVIASKHKMEELYRTAQSSQANQGKAKRQSEVAEETEETSANLASTPVATVSDPVGANPIPGKAHQQRVNRARQGIQVHPNGKKRIKGDSLAGSTGQSLTQPRIRHSNAKPRRRTNKYGSNFLVPNTANSTSVPAGEIQPPPDVAPFTLASVQSITSYKPQEVMAVNTRSDTKEALNRFTEAAENLQLPPNTASRILEIVRTVDVAGVVEGAAYSNKTERRAAWNRAGALPQDAPSLELALRHAVRNEASGRGSGKRGRPARSVSTSKPDVPDSFRNLLNDAHTVVAEQSVPTAASHNVPIPQPQPTEPNPLSNMEHKQQQHLTPISTISNPDELPAKPDAVVPAHPTNTVPKAVSRRENRAGRQAADAALSASVAPERRADVSSRSNLPVGPRTGSAVWKARRKRSMQAAPARNQSASNAKQDYKSADN